MHRRSLLVGFGLGLLLAGIASMCAIQAQWWHMGPDAAQVVTTERGPSGSDSVNSDSYRYDTRYGMHGWYGPHWGFFGFPFMVLRCLLPLLLIGFIFSIFRRRRWHRWGRWHHGHHWHHQDPTPPIV